MRWYCALPPHTAATRHDAWPLCGCMLRALGCDGLPICITAGRLSAPLAGSHCCDRHASLRDRYASVRDRYASVRDRYASQDPIPATGYGLMSISTAVGGASADHGGLPIPLRNDSLTAANPYTNRNAR